MTFKKSLVHWVKTQFTRPVSCAQFIRQCCFKDYQFRMLRATAHAPRTILGTDQRNYFQWKHKTFMNISQIKNFFLNLTSLHRFAQLSHSLPDASCPEFIHNFSPLASKPKQNINVSHFWSFHPSFQQMFMRFSMQRELFMKSSNIMFLFCRSLTERKFSASSTDWQWCRHSDTPSEWVNLKIVFFRKHKSAMVRQTKSELLSSSD